MSPAPIPQLTDEQYQRLDFEAVRCIGCTPCCMSHVHFLYRDSVLWACQTKMERQRATLGDAPSATAANPSTPEGGGAS